MLCISTVFAGERFQSVFPSVRPSRSGIVSALLNLSSKFLHHVIAQRLVFYDLSALRNSDGITRNKGLKNRRGIYIWVFTELFAGFDKGVINVLRSRWPGDLAKSSLAINSTAPSDLWYTLFCGRLMNGRINRAFTHLSVGRLRQHRAGSSAIAGFLVYYRAILQWTFSPICNGEPITYLSNKHNEQGNHIIIIFPELIAVEEFYKRAPNVCHKYRCCTNIWRFPFRHK